MLAFLHTRQGLWRLVAVKIHVETVTTRWFHLGVANFAIVTVCDSTQSVCNNA